MHRAEALPDRPTLVVDLDGSLVRTDTLRQLLRVALRDRPSRLLRALGALRHGRARFKQAVADIVELDPAALPYNADVIAYLRDERKTGRRVILATAADRRVAVAVATHLGLFDAVLASDGVTNLKGSAKLAAIRETVGGQAFVYIGNERADLAVWRGAAAAILVGAGASLTRAAAAVAPIERAFPGRSTALPSPLRADLWVRRLRSSRRPGKHTISAPPPPDDRRC